MKHADRWPPAYYRAINQLADVIATFPPEKVPPFQLREVTDDPEIALGRRHRAHYVYVRSNRRERLAVPQVAGGGRMRGGSQARSDFRTCGNGGA